MASGSGPSGGLGSDVRIWWGRGWAVGMEVGVWVGVGVRLGGWWSGWWFRGEVGEGGG